MLHYISQYFEDHLYFLGMILLDDGLRNLSSLGVVVCDDQLRGSTGSICCTRTPPLNEFWLPADIDNGPRQYLWVPKVQSRIHTSCRLFVNPSSSPPGQPPTNTKRHSLFAQLYHLHIELRRFLEWLDYYQNHRYKKALNRGLTSVQNVSLGGPGTFIYPVQTNTQMLPFI